MSSDSAILERRSARPFAIREGIDPRRLAPTLVAAAFAIAYVIISPPSLDLAAHLLRAKLFASEGFGLWNNWWYAGHDVPGYSVLFPPVAALLTPQVAAAIACAASAALFEMLLHDHFGEDAWLGALWFGAATATNLYTGRLTFAFGLLPAIASVVALQRGRPWPAVMLAVLAALASPVAGLFAALAGGAYAVGKYVSDRRIRVTLPGVGVVIGALAPVGALAVAFPEGGSEPFTFATLWPILAIAGFAFFALPANQPTLRAGIVLYIAGCILSYGIATPVGSNVARLGPLVAGPFAAAILWPKRKLLLALVAIPLLYIQWQAPIRDVSTAARDPSLDSGYYQPLLSFLERQPRPPFRVEIPFTSFHWEAYEIAPRFPLARGWERQLDIKDNSIFYNGTLNAATYEAWLHALAVRFVAVPDAPLDYSAHQEKALIDRGLPYLRPVFHSRHWRVYAVANATPIAQGAATLRAMGANSLELQASRPGKVFVRVRYSPYWALSEGSGCVAQAGQFTELSLRHAGAVRLVMSFALDRIGATSTRCS